MAPYIKRSAIWPDPRVKPPFGAVEIDWTHPLAQGLVSCFLLNEGGGEPLDLATGLVAVLEHHATMTDSMWASRPGGVYFRCGGTTSDTGWAFQAAAAALADVTSEDFTIVLDIYPDSVDPTSTSAVYASHGGPGDGKGWQISRPPGAALRFTSFGSSTASRTTAAGSITNGRLNRVVLARHGTGTSAVHFYIDGVEPTYSSSQSIQNPITTTFPYLIGGVYDGFSYGAIPRDGIDRALFYRDRTLSQADAVWLYEEPYCFLRPLVRRRYWEPRRFLLGRH
jgi:hypothetical protein